jgi:apolipoprotein N-acyltransferase
MHTAGEQAVESTTEPRRFSWLTAFLVAAASGGLMAACFRPFNLHCLAWIALVPWLISLPRLSPAATWLFGIVLGLVFYRIGLDWLIEIAGPVAGATIVVLAVWMGFAFRVARLLMERFGPASMLWTVPLTFVGAEVLRCEGLPRLRFSFLAFGYSQSQNFWIAQIASIGGVYFLSLLLVAVNSAIAYGLWQRRRGAWMPAMVVAAGVIVLTLISQPPSFAPENTVTVACVQGEELRYREYLDLVARAASAHPKPAFIVLPEHTITEAATEGHRMVAGLIELAREHGVYACVGAHVASQGKGCPYDNVAMLIGPVGIIGSQAKAVPLPFFDDGNPARSQAAFDTIYGRIGMYVCYDGLFTDHPRRLAGLGAALILVPVMDPARWPAQEQWQHADMAPIRSIELRRSTVRAASSGVSQIIDPLGRIIAQRTRDEGAGIVTASVPLCNRRTFFMWGGHLLAAGIGGAFLLTIVVLTLQQWVCGLASLFRRDSRRT